jgi:hypothetical protein
MRGLRKGNGGAATHPRQRHEGHGDLAGLRLSMRRRTTQRNFYIKMMQRLGASLPDGS